MAPSTMKAIKIIEPGKAEVKEVPLPKPRDQYILVKVLAVALNPTDWKHIHYMATPGATVGCDSVGIVEEIGSKVTRPFKKGDRITAMIYGSNSAQLEDGSFAEYALIKGDIAFKVPDNITDEQAASLPVGYLTCGQVMYLSLQLPLPGQAKYGKPFLVYGGSTATGTLAIQLAKLSGARVVTTCSPRNFELVKSLGAEAAFDYNDPECGKKIWEYTNDSLEKAFDCISEGKSMSICEQALSSKGGEVSDLLPAKHERTDISSRVTMAYTLIGEECNIRGKKIPANPDDFEFAKKFSAITADLLEKGQLVNHPIDARQGGLEGVLSGLNDLKDGKVSGKKLVYRIA